MDDLLKLLKQLGEALDEAMGDDELSTEEREAIIEPIAEQLNEHAPTLHDFVNNRGFNVGRKKGQGDAKGWKKEKKALETKIERLQTKIDKLEDEQPDVAEIKAEYQGEIDDLTRQIEEKEEEFEQYKRTNKRDTAITRLRNLLEGDLFDFAARGLANDPDVLDRIYLTDEGEVEVYQKGKKIPLSSDDQIEALYKELIADQPDKLFKSGVQGGTGENGSDGGGGGKSELDKAREAGKEAANNSAATRSKQLNSVFPAE